MEALAWQDKLKVLEEQRDFEVNEAEYKVYAEEELRLNVEIGDPEIIDTLTPNQLPR